MKLTTTSIKMFLKKQGIELADCDHLHIDNMVHCMKQCIILRDQIDREGAVISNDRGPVAHPAVIQYKVYTNMVVQWARDFGLTPKSRKELLRGAEVAKETGFNLNRKVI